MPERIKKGEEKFEPISKEDAVPEREKVAFTEMLRQIELGKNDIYDDPQSAEELEKIIETLPTQEQKDVIRARFFEKKTLEEVGKDLGVSRERIRQIQNKALSMLKHPTRLKRLQNLENFEL